MNLAKSKIPESNPRSNCPSQNTIFGEKQSYDIAPLNPQGWVTHKDIRAMKNWKIETFSKITDF